MLDELSYLPDAVPGGVAREIYANAAMDGSCLARGTAANRKLSLQRLTELYGVKSIITSWPRPAARGTSSWNPSL